jgi:hypothetical protein
MNQSVSLNSTAPSPSTMASSIPLSGFTWPTLSRAIVTSFSALTSFMNIAVFVHPKLKDVSYKYMLIISLSNFIYSLFQLAGTIFTTCLTCATANTYLTAFFNIYFGLFSSSFLALFRITVQCTVAFNTYCILTNRNWLSRISYKLILPILFIISAALYTFQPIGITIGSFVSINGNTQYIPLPNSFFLSDFYSNMLIALNVLRLALIVFVVTTLNVLNVIEFRKRYKTRIFAISKTNNNNANTMVESAARTGIKLSTFSIYFIKLS